MNANALYTVYTVKYYLNAIFSEFPLLWIFRQMFVKYFLRISVATLTPKPGKIMLNNYCKDTEIWTR